MQFGLENPFRFHEGLDIPVVQNIEAEEEEVEGEADDMTVEAPVVEDGEPVEEKV